MLCGTMLANIAISLFVNLGTTTLSPVIMASYPAWATMVTSYLLSHFAVGLSASRLWGRIKIGVSVGPGIRHVNATLLSRHVAFLAGKP